MTHIWPTHCTVKRLGPLSWHWTVHLAIEDGPGIATTGHRFTKTGAKRAAAREFEKEKQRIRSIEKWTPK